MSAASDDETFEMINDQRPAPTGDSNDQNSKSNPGPGVTQNTSDFTPEAQQFLAGLEKTTSPQIVPPEKSDDTFGKSLDWKKTGDKHTVTELVQQGVSPQTASLIVKVQDRPSKRMYEAMNKAQRRLEEEDPSSSEDDMDEDEAIALALMRLEKQRRKDLRAQKRQTVALAVGTALHEVQPAPRAAGGIPAGQVQSATSPDQISPTVPIAAVTNNKTIPHRTYSKANEKPAKLRRDTPLPPEVAALHNDGRYLGYHLFKDENIILMRDHRDKVTTKFFSQVLRKETYFINADSPLFGKETDLTPYELRKAMRMWRKFMEVTDESGKPRVEAEIIDRFENEWVLMEAGKNFEKDPKYYATCLEVNMARRRSYFTDEEFDFDETLLMTEVRDGRADALSEKVDALEQINAKLMAQLANGGPSRSTPSFSGAAKQDKPYSNGNRQYSFLGPDQKFLNCMACGRLSHHILKCRQSKTIAGDDVIIQTNNHTKNANFKTRDGSPDICYWFNVKDDGCRNSAAHGSRVTHRCSLCGEHAHGAYACNKTAAAIAAGNR